MLCVSCKNKLPDSLHGVDIIEVREEMPLLQKPPLPLIVKASRWSPKLLHSHPDYIDLPHTAKASDFRSIPSSIKSICSFHDEEKTPLDLDAIYAKMQRTKADYYKIATWANSSLDALRLLHFIRRTKVLGVAMGPEGSFARIAALVMGVPWMYVSANKGEETASGQLSLAEMREIYHAHRLTPRTALYALIGDPITASISHRSHNMFFRAQGIDALYLKIRVRPDELESFLSLAQEVGFQGLSVTMPLKKKILSYLPPTDLPAINTLTQERGVWEGSNSDGRGAVEALEKVTKTEGKQVLILGEGGAALAIYDELKRLAVAARCISIREKRETFPPVDILINATPIDPPFFPFAPVVMDLRVAPQKTPFLQEAEKRGATIIEGIEMFKQQAFYQMRRWFHA